MKVLLYRNLIVDDGGLPKITMDSKGIALPDQLVLQYEQIRAAYVAARDNLIDAYKKAGGKY
jgi:hypothetical protein